MKARALTIGVVSATLAIAGAMPASAGGSSGGGRDETGESLSARGPVLAPGTTTRTADFASVRNPNAEYTSGSCAIDLSDISDGDLVGSVTGCDGVTARFSTDTKKRSVPDTWLTWGYPPRVESSTPHILSSNGPSTLTVTYSREVLLGGVELKQVEFQKTTSTVNFYSGPNGGGTLLGSITRHTKARYGAKLFAAQTDGFRSIVITNNDGMYFAIGQLRV